MPTIVPDGFVLLMDSPAKYIDHTLLKADSTALEIAALCEDAVEYDFASVCIPPAYVSQAKKLLYGSEVNVCTVIGFPLGYQKTEVKVFETSGAVESGADEVDMVINLGAARVADYGLVEEDISRVVAASDAALVKVILECCLFADDVKQRLAAVAVAAGADFVKTSTGFAASGATVGDVKLLAAAVAGNAGVKAAGGIRDWKTCEVMLSAGANRVGTSAGVAIMRQWQRCAGLT